MKQRIARWFIAIDEWKHRDTLAVALIAGPLLALFIGMAWRELDQPTGTYNIYLPVGWVVAPVVALYLTGRRKAHAAMVRLLLGGVTAVVAIPIGATLVQEPDFAFGLLWALAGPGIGIVIATTVQRRQEATEAENRHNELVALLRTQLAAADEAAERRHQEVIKAVSSRRTWWRGRR